MPIRPENRGRYPAEWPAISQAIRDAAAHRCQRCGVPDRAMIRRGATDSAGPLWRLAGSTAYENGFSAETGEEVDDTGEDTVDWGRPVTVILTVAHLDHTPENCDPDNLRAWCQRCHNGYDAPMRAAGLRQRRKARLAARDLFDGTTP